MHMVKPKVKHLGTVMTPSGTIFPTPRQYFDIQRPISPDQANNLLKELREACKHVTNVVPCKATQKGESASFYVAYGMDSDAKLTEERLDKYKPDVLRALDAWLATL